MNKQLFLDILKKFIAYEEYVDKLQNLNIDIVETPSFEISGFLFDRLIEAYFDEEGINWINWFMFEKRNDPNLKAFDEDDNEICKDIDELWDLVSGVHMK